jgi:hypothetical protein
MKERYAEPVLERQEELQEETAGEEPIISGLEPGS